MRLAYELVHWVKSSDDPRLRDAGGAPLAWELIVAAAAARLAGDAADDVEHGSEPEALARRRGRELADDLATWIRSGGPAGAQSPHGAPPDAGEVLLGVREYLAYQARRTQPPEPPPWPTRDQPS
jgi:hypothetical protein